MLTFLGRERKSKKKKGEETEGSNGQRFRERKKQNLRGEGVGLETIRILEVGLSRLCLKQNL